MSQQDQHIHGIHKVLVLGTDEAKAQSLASLLNEVGIELIKTAIGKQSVQLPGAEHDFDAVFIFATEGKEFAKCATSAAFKMFPLPLIVLVGVEDLSEKIELAQHGDAVSLPWPAKPADVLQCLTFIVSAEARLKSAFSFAVGRMSLKDAQRWGREVMLIRALSNSRGSRRGAANILRVSRPAIQRMTREMSDLDELKELLYDSKAEERDIKAKR